MKKKIVIKVVALIVIASACIYFSMEWAGNKEYLTVTQLANIDALVQSEGTKVGDCHISMGIGASGWYEFCDKQTTNDMIYPCPNRSTFGSSAGKNKCTK